MSRLPFITIFTAALLLLTFSCGGEKTNEPDPIHDELIEIESQLDSGNVMFDRLLEMGDSTFSNRADTALYLLNLARAAKMNNLVFTDDSILSISTTYFTETNQTRRAMLAWYYRACILFDNGKFPEAVYCALKMKPYADELNDHLFLARFGDILGHANNAFGQSGAGYYVYALEQYYAYDPNDSYMVRFFYNNAYSNYLEDNKLDSALMLNERIKELALNSDWPDFIEQWRRHNQISHDERRMARYREAEELYNQIAPQGQSFDPETVESMVLHRLRKAMIYDDSVALNEAKMLIADGASEILLGSDGTITPKELNEEQILGLSERFEPATPAHEEESGYVTSLRFWSIAGVALLVVIILILGLLPLFRRH